jgi:hypothetical protein
LSTFRDSNRHGTIIKPFFKVVAWCGGDENAAGRAKPEMKVVGGNTKTVDAELDDQVPF